MLSGVLCISSSMKLGRPYEPRETVLTDVAVIILELSR